VLEGGRWAGGAWLLAAFSIPLLPDLLRAPLRPRLLGTAALFAALAAFAAWTESRGWRWSWAPCLATLVLPFLLAGPVAGIAPPRQAETPELQALAAWAREATPQDAVFLFPDAGKGVEPGIFRARALRALYVDWKSGGQVNFLRRLGYEWWRRWQQTGAGRFKPWHLPAYRRWGIDYIVLPAARRLPNRQSAFQNSSYVVYLTQ
jgi:hypothetical protein